MNPLAQPDIHPDADSLNAFVELALPETERARIVAHMAECSRCREVVYLAQAAAGEEPEAALPPGSKAESRRGWWSPAWRIVWIPAAALATVGGVFIWIQSRPTPPNTTLAQLAPESSARSSKPPAPAAMDQAATALNQPAPPPPQIAAKRIEPLMSNGALAGRKQEARGEVKEKTLLQSSQMSAVGASSAGEDAAFLPRQTPGQEAPVTPASAPVRPALSNAQLQPLQPTEGSQIVRSRAMAAAPAPTPPNMLAVHGALAAPAPATGGPSYAVQPVPQLQLKLFPQPLSNLTAARLARRPRLPSGLNAVSVASMQSRLIAIDSDGAMFLSQDSGKPWEPIPPQWAGKAIEVHAEPRVADALMSASQTVSVESASPVPSPADKPTDESSTATPPPRPSPLNAAHLEAAPHVPMLFKLVTDRHQTWISEDGKIWRRQ